MGMGKRSCGSFQLVGEDSPIQFSHEIEGTISPVHSQVFPGPIDTYAMFATSPPGWNNASREGTLEPGISSLFPFGVEELPSLDGLFSDHPKTPKTHRSQTTFDARALSYKLKSSTNPLTMQIPLQTQFQHLSREDLESDFEGYPHNPVLPFVLRDPNKVHIGTVIDNSSTTNNKRKNIDRKAVRDPSIQKKKKSAGRVKVACIPCHKSKVLCGDVRPCPRCVRMKREDRCKDRPQRKMGRPPKDASTH